MRLSFPFHFLDFFRSIAHLSRLSEYFRHTSTCNPSCFLPFVRPEVEKKGFFLKKFQIIYLLLGKCWKAETAAKGPNGFFWEVNRPGEVFSRRPRKKYTRFSIIFEKKMRPICGYYSINFIRIWTKICLRTVLEVAITQTFVHVLIRGLRNEKWALKKFFQRNAIF